MGAIFPLVTIFAPLLGTLLIALFWRDLGERVARLAIAALWCSALASLVTLVVVLSGDTIRLSLVGTSSGTMTYTLLVDRLAAVMLALISLVSLIIHVYSERCPLLCVARDADLRVVEPVQQRQPAVDVCLLAPGDLVTSDVAGV